ncbi:AzlC family ABC transporter permease [Nocardioides sp. AE5]|uniref:AzlC family ABC transporter permease n=1 Tax=Nocardioides sp. AE5 TaxID=2962573 RepID=UPI0028821F75|nr:AzlC family ABC transporter permease [Nocardioides sp. AE5]MDT0203027.1 AzlC family ABC transporter permease [Nocardioides sp. AE5]
MAVRPLTFLRQWRDDLGPALLRDIVLVNLAICLVGISYGAITVGEGLPVWLPNVMSVVVLAGASQFLFTGIIATGGGVVAAVLAGILVNLRHLPFGFALADTVRERPLLGSYLMIDEVVAFSLAQKEAEVRRKVFFTCGFLLLFFWNLGSLLGALLGQAITDTEVFGLDAAFPAVLLALVMPALREASTLGIAVLGAAIALALTPFLPAGTAVLCALLALVAARPWRAEPP